MCELCGHQLSGHVNGVCFCVTTLYTGDGFKVFPCPCGKKKDEPERDTKSEG